MTYPVCYEGSGMTLCLSVVTSMVEETYGIHSLPAIMYCVFLSAFFDCRDVLRRDRVKKAQGIWAAHYTVSQQTDVVKFVSESHE